jgi:hypothetical protein
MQAMFRRTAADGERRVGADDREDRAERLTQLLSDKEVAAQAGEAELVAYFDKRIEDLLNEARAAAAKDGRDEQGRFTTQIRGGEQTDSGFGAGARRAVEPAPSMNTMFRQLSGRA